jgi:D-xylose transport system substrate-binding protein
VNGVSRAVVLLLTAVLVATGLAGCRSEDKMVVALLLASDLSPRWAESDEPAFAEFVGLHCPDCVYLSENAEGDADKQAAQLDKVIAAGADVVVLNAVSGEQGERLVVKADKAGVPVVAYDRFVAGADYYVSYDAGAIGREMARAVVERLPAKASVLVVNGAQTDSNGVAIKKAVHRVLSQAGVTIVAELDPATWSAEEAGGWLRAWLRKRPIAGVDAIIAGNDVQAQGVAGALAEAKVLPRNWPIVTGQDADIEAIRRIVAGQQTLTVFKSFPREAEKAADVAVTLVTGHEVKDAVEREGVPSFVFEPLVVTIDNLTDTVVRDGIYTLTDICDTATLPDCARLGLR